MKPVVSVVIPSLNRTERLKDCLDQLLTSAPDAEIIVVADKSDKRTIELVRSYELVRCVTQESNGPVEAWNVGAAAAQGDYLVLGADDLWFYDEWYEEALAAMDSIGRYGVVGFNDLSPLAGSLATHYMVSRSYAVNEWGGVLAMPYYQQQWIDNEATSRAKRDECFVYAEDAVVEHMHPIWDKATSDDTYAMAESEGRYQYGERVFTERAALGFPNKHKPYFDMNIAPADGWGTVAVATRVYKYPEPAFLASFAGMLGRGMRKGDRVIDVTSGYPGHIAANHYVRAFLNTTAHSLLFIDDDMAFDANALEVLRSNQDSWGYDVVMGFCTHKTIPPHAVVMRLHETQPSLPVALMGERLGTLRDIPNNAVIDVDAVGLAFTLIKRHVLEQMVNEYGAIYTSWFDWGKHSEGEDIVFSRRCRERGFKLAVDTSVKIGHVGRYTFGWSDFNEWQSQERGKRE